MFLNIQRDPMVPGIVQYISFIGTNRRCLLQHIANPRHGLNGWCALENILGVGKQEHQRIYFRQMNTVYMSRRMSARDVLGVVIKWVHFLFVIHVNHVASVGVHVGRTFTV